jgi:hypothetical protein
MNSQLQSLFNKLTTLELNSKVNPSRESVTHIFQILIKRLPLIGEAKLILMAILLQGYDITLFTDEELVEVSKFNLSSIEVINPPYVDRNVVSPFKAPLFDTGSMRIYYDVSDTDTTSLQGLDRPSEVLYNLMHTYKP